MQTACLAPRYRRVRAGRLPTAPVTTNHHLRPAERGPGSPGGQHLCGELETARGGLPTPTQGRGSGNRLGGWSRTERRGVGGMRRGEGWAGGAKSRTFSHYAWSQARQRVRPPQCPGESGDGSVTRGAVLSAFTKALGSLRPP